LHGFQVELSSAKEVADILPNIDEIRKLSCGGVMLTGPAPAGSGYDFFTRLFCPKFGMDEVISFLGPKSKHV
jgi:predicted PhzF superfamily epimerase YddE/YHI9